MDTTLDIRRTAFQLSIESDLALPSLLPDRNGSEHPPDVNVRLGKVSSDGLAGGVQIGPLLWTGENQVWLSVPGVARFQIENGCHIVVDPAPGTDEDSLRLFLMGSAMGVLLFQRGHLVLHGNAVRVGEHCMVCVGRSGAGKSTLAAGFMRRGYHVLADDVVPVNEAGMALPGFPRIKLWQDSADQLQLDTQGLRRVRPDLDKYDQPLEAHFAQQALPIRWIYHLESDRVAQVRVEAILGMQRFAVLHDNTYRVQYLQGMSLKPHHLQQCSRLANQVRLARATRPAEGFALEALIDSLLADMAAHP